MTKKTECDTMKILIKALQPNRQKILTADGEEMRLQQWANKQAASSLRDTGGDVQGEQFTQSRDMLMRDAVENPEKHGLKFMGERLPFEGQTLQESLTEPDVEGERAAIDGEFAGEEKPETPDLFDSEGKLRDGMPTDEEDEKMRQETGEPSFASKEEAMAATFNPDKEAEHMRRIMTSRQVPMRDAWSVLKQEPYNPAPTPKQEYLQSLRFPDDAGNRREFQRMPGEKHGPNDKFFRYGEDPYVPKGHGENPMRAERPHPYSQLGADVMEDHQLMQEEPEDNQLLTPDELAFAQLIAENDMQMPPAASIPAPTLREGMNQYNP